MRRERQPEWGDLTFGESSAAPAAHGEIALYASGEDWDDEGQRESKRRECGCVILLFTMAIEAGLDTLYRAVDILVTEPGDLSARLEQAGAKLLSLNLLPQYEGYPAPFRRGYEELKKGLTAHGDISQTIGAAKDDEKKRLAFKIIDLYCSALRRS